MLIQLPIPREYSLDYTFNRVKWPDAEVSDKKMVVERFYYYSGALILGRKST